MALFKQCDNPECGKKLGGEKPFVQMQGTLCDQLELADGSVQFRYVSDRKVHTFCDDECDMRWRAYQREGRPFRQD